MEDRVLEKYYKSLNNVQQASYEGYVISVKGMLVSAHLPVSQMGSICEIVSSANKKKILCEVVGFEDDIVYLMPFLPMQGISSGAKVYLKSLEPEVKISPSLLGRVIDGLGEPLDDKGPISYESSSALYKQAPNPLKREPISDVLSLGVKAIDGFTTIGKGQRAAILAGSGVGKSVLLGMMAKNSSADVNVIALIGERGREAREFIEQILDEESLKRSVIIVVTSDQSSVMRMRGAFLATSIAEYFSEQQNDVLLMMDSLTRFAMAQREIGLSVGEPPTTKGYTPSVFSLLPKLLERVGKIEGKGSVTGLYTVLVEADDMNDPIADSVRSIVDGHIVLTRKLAEQGHYPAIDILQSASRLMNHIVDDEHRSNALNLKRLISSYNEAIDLINIGAYQAGSNPSIDAAIRLKPAIDTFLMQNEKDEFNFDNARIEMEKILGA